MINKITIGISQALCDEFGYTNYIDAIEQGLDEPCFLITLLTDNETHVVMQRYERDYSFMIQYFPKTWTYRAECNDVTDRLMNCLECIMVDGNLLRGSDMSAQITDGVLNFSISYKPQVTKVMTSLEDEIMGDYTQNMTVKE